VWHARSHLRIRSSAARRPAEGSASSPGVGPFKQACSVQKMVATRAEEAGLGHMSPADLRRSAAGILHRAVSDDGAHYFDLLDIQKVLGHANPATTTRSYIDPIDTGVIRRAAQVLD
jgi:integrase